MPTIALVGRTNVGKSTLFNRLTRRTESIVFDQSGVTRDYLHEVVSIGGKLYDLVDTGGLSGNVQKSKDPFQQHIQEVGLAACARARVIVFMCDITSGVTEDDRLLVRLLQTYNKPIILVLNKADHKKALEEFAADFFSLGCGDFIPVSATHGTGVQKLLDTIADRMPMTDPNDTEASLPQRPACKIALLGKPNVGKSSLMNALLEQERSIVSDIAGTTREAISERFSFYGQDLQLTDTAGVRRKRKVNEDLEELMVKSSLQAVRDADIVVLVVDSNEGRLSDQELKLMFYAFEQHKGLLIVFNKRDLMDQEKENLLAHELDPYNYFLKNIPQLRISCTTGKNVGLVMREIDKLRQRLSQQFNGEEVTLLIQQHLLAKPLFHKTVRLLVHKIRQKDATSPTFALTVNYAEWFGQSQLACLENVLRKKYDLRGCPVSFVVHKPRRK